MSIVQINVSQTVAPAPITLQSTGAIVSQGATTIPANAYELLTQDSDLTPFLAPPLALTALAWSGGNVVATTAAAIPGRNVGDGIAVTIAGATPAAYNGTYAATVTGANTFTYALAVNPGPETVAGTYTPPGQVELLAQVNTFFDQGASQAVYVLELGPGDQTTSPALLQTWIQNNPGIFYAYLVPRGWDASAGLLALQAGYQNPTSKTYFFVTTKTSTYQTYTGAMKAIIALVEAPGIPFTEFSLAAAFQHWLSYAPSASNRMTPFRYAYMFGVTPYPQVGNNALLQQLTAAAISYIGTGAEGGISNSILNVGKTKDGNDATYWYSADWFQLQSDQALANAVINGSNDPLNPLYYNQPGINVLQDVLVQVAQSAITFGLANGSVTQTALDGPVFQQNLDDGDYPDQNVINAVPFLTYINENPGNYEAELYGGFSAVYIPQRGFGNIVFNVNVTSLLTQ